MPGDPIKEALAFLDECLKEDEARDNVTRAEQALEDLVPKRIAAKGRKRIDVKKAEAPDWLACSFNDIYGLNLDEYKKRCRIRKMHYTPEQLRIDKEELRSR